MLIFVKIYVVKFDIEILQFCLVTFSPLCI